jgi:hypothetical protein
MNTLILKLKITVFILLITAINAYSQVYFTYDDAGNRTTRSIHLVKATSAINEQDSLTYSHMHKDSVLYTDFDQKIKIYPNPTKGQLKVELKGFDLTQKSGIYVYNPTGILILQKTPAHESDVIDLSNYSIGIYVMRIIISDKVSEWKIIKE